MQATMFFVVLAILASLTQTGTAAVWVFGDSNVDTGWYKVYPYSGDAAFDTFLANSALGVGKPTNNPGPMSVEVLATLLQTTANPANQGGSNFATSGAKNFNKNDDGFKNAVPTWTQLEIYRHPGLGANRAACRPGGIIFCRPRPGTNDIFLINSGGNDVGFAVNNKSGTDRTNYLQLQATLLAQAVSFLPPFGARQIIVANQQEGSGPTPDVMMARHDYNVALRSALDHYVKGALYAWADINSVREDIKADKNAGGTKFGILNVNTNSGSTACVRPDMMMFPNLQTAWALVCSANTTVSPLNTNTTVVQHTLFADDQHWAAVAQRVLASYYYCLIKTTWPQLVPQTIQLPHEPKVPPIPCEAFSGIAQPKPPPLR